MEKSPIIFLPVPDSLKDEIRKDSFEVDPSIPLPAELVPAEPDYGEQSSSEASGRHVLDPSTLSWEMILSGMLRIISACGTITALPSGSGKQLKPGDIVSEPEKAGIPSEWIDYYRRFVFAVKPEIYHEFSGAAIVKAGNGEFDMALEINAVLEGLFPRSPGVMLNKALILEEKAAALEKNGREAERENADALEAYETALSLEPVLPDTFFNAGFFFMQRRDFARAKDCFSRYATIDDESEMSGEKKKQALKIIRDIGGQGLDDDSYREAYDYVSRGDDEKGLLKIREFIEKHPRVWNGWFVLGWALRKLCRYGDALDAFKKAAELGGVSGDTRNEMAICLMELGDLKGARKELEAALREEPENIKIISNMGVLAMKAGNTAEAAAFFRTVLELDKDDPLAKHFLEEI